MSSHNSVSVSQPILNPIRTVSTEPFTPIMESVLREAPAQTIVPQAVNINLGGASGGKVPSTKLDIQKGISTLENDVAVSDEYYHQVSNRKIKAHNDEIERVKAKRQEEIEAMERHGVKIKEAENLIAELKAVQGNKETEIKNLDHEVLRLEKKKQAIIKMQTECAAADP
jgi:hypothetical protein